MLAKFLPPTRDTRADFQQHIEETAIMKVWCLQRTITPNFRDVRSLQQLVALLEVAQDIPMCEPFLILRGVLACMRCPTGGRVRRHYTFDHRRLWCMHMAGCSKLRFEVVLPGPLVDETFSQADGIGRPAHELKVRKPNFVPSVGPLAEAYAAVLGRHFEPWRE